MCGGRREKKVLLLCFFLPQSLWRMQVVQKEIAAKNLSCPSSFGFVTDAANVKESLMHLQLPLGKDWEIGQTLSVIVRI